MGRRGICVRGEVAPSAGEIERTLAEFEKTAWAGLDPGRYTWSAVLHRERGGGVHVHVLAARCDLETGKSLNIAPPGWQKAFDPLRDALNHEHGWQGYGYDSALTGDPGEVASLMKTSRPDLVLLDLVLPGTDGSEVMSRIPALGDIPVIFLSGYGRDESIARALQAGAIEYSVKPFSPTELVASVSVVLRERRTSPLPCGLGAPEVDYGAHRVSVAGRPVRLTATEFRLLRELSVRAGRGC